MTSKYFLKIQQKAQHYLYWRPSHKDLGKNGKLIPNRKSVIEECREMQKNILQLLQDLSNLRYDKEVGDEANRLTVQLTQQRVKLSIMSDVVIRKSKKNKKD